MRNLQVTSEAVRISEFSGRNHTETAERWAKYCACRSIQTRGEGRRWERNPEEIDKWGGWGSRQYRPLTDRSKQGVIERRIQQEPQESSGISDGSSCPDVYRGKRRQLLKDVWQWEDDHHRGLHGLTKVYFLYRIRKMRQFCLGLRLRTGEFYWLKIRI